MLGAILGAVVSQYTKNGGHWAWHFVNGSITISTWAWLTKCSALPLMVTSVIWDIIYTVTWTATMYLVAGDEIGTTQLVGVVIILIGLFLLGR